MKSSILLTILALLSFGAVFGQIKIGDNPQLIDPSSVLELESAERVLVITRVSTAAMQAIRPRQGALVYNTDVQCVHYFNGTDWINLCGSGGGGTANITAEPIIHDIPTIALTPAANGTNIEIALNSIRSEMIVDGGVNGVDIQNGSIGPGKLQNNSVTRDKLSENAVGLTALDHTNIDLGDFTNNAGYLTNANSVSTAAGNVITNNGGVYYNDTPLRNDIQANTTALNNLTTPTLQEVLGQGRVANGLIQGVTNPVAPQDAATKLYVDTRVAAGGGNPNDELITNAVLTGTDLVITEAGTTWTVPLGSLAGGGSTVTIASTPSITVAGTGTAGDPYELTVVGGSTGSTEVVDGITLTGAGTPGDAFKIEPSTINGQFLRTDPTSGAVVWANLPAGTGGAVNSDGTTIIGDGVATDLQVNDAGITPIKIEPSTTTGQFLSTDATGNVVWANLPPSGASAIFDPLAISGTGVVGDEYTIAGNAINSGRIANETVLSEDILDGTLVSADLANNAVTTPNITDANVTPIKIAPSTTTGQFLSTDATGNVAWANLPPSGASALFDPLAISGTGVVGDEYTIALNAVNSARIANETVLSEDILDGAIVSADLANNAVTTPNITDANVTPIKIAPSTTTGQFLSTDATGNVAWANLPLGGSQNLFETDLTLTANRTHNLGGNNFVLSGSGNVAIGSLPGAPQDKLDVDGQIRARLGFASTAGTAGNPGYGFYTGGNTNMGMFRAGVDNLGFSTVGVEVIRIDENQNVGIGIPNPSEKLHVIGNILASGTITPDYVFQTYYDGISPLKPEYKLLSLSEIEDYVRSNKHLPGVPSATEVEEQGGILINKATETNLEKIEELYLHTIAQEKKINQLQNENHDLAQELANLKKELETIKNLIKNK
ncbi:MAG: hypothetical protein WBM83_12200 [Flavobacteriaceae bacterium]